MQYLLLIYQNEKSPPMTDPAAREKMFLDYRAFTQSIINSGHMKGGNALQPTSAATTVRMQNGKVLSTDGPFAETKEQLGGYYLVEAKDLDEAIKLAARVPSAQFGSIEVRPINPMPPDYPRP